MIGNAGTRGSAEFPIKTSLRKQGYEESPLAPARLGVFVKEVPSYSPPGETHPSLSSSRADMSLFRAMGVSRNHLRSDHKLSTFGHTPRRKGPCSAASVSPGVCISAASPSVHCSQSRGFSGASNQTDSQPYHAVCLLLLRLPQDQAFPEDTSPPCSQTRIMGLLHTTVNGKMNDSTLRIDSDKLFQIIVKITPRAKQCY